MHRLTSRLLLALFTLTCCSFAASADDKVKFPSDDPAFTVELPSGWTHEFDKDGNLNCEPGDDSGYAFSILTLAHVQNEKELRAELPKLANAMASGAKLKDFEVGDVETSKNGNGIRFTGVTGDGKNEGVKFVVLVHGFEPQKGKFYAIVTAGSAKADKKHEKDYDEITASIEALD